MFTFVVGRCRAECFSPPKIHFSNDSLTETIRTNLEPLHAGVPALLNVGDAAQVHE